MDRFDRIFELNRLLQSSRRPVSRRKIEEALECSRATAKRIVEDMRLYLNAPIVYSREHNGYHYDQREGEMYDVAGLVAPRWFRAIAGKDDPIFPINGVRESFGHLKKVYGVAGADDHCELYVGDGGHRYYSDGVWPFVRKAFGSLAQSG